MQYSNRRLTQQISALMFYGMNHMPLQDLTYTDMVRRNVGNELSALAEQHPGTAKATSGMFSSNMGSSGAIFESAPYTTNICFNPLNPELNPICYLLALLGAHHFLHVSRIRVQLLTFRLLKSYIYIYMEHPFLMFLDHTQRRSTVGRTPLDE